MNPDILDIDIYKGCSWDMTVSLTTYTPPSGSVTDFDLTVFIALSQVRKNYDTNVVAAYIVCDIPVSSGCLINLSLKPSATNIPAGDYVWDLIISGTDSGSFSGTKYPIYHGAAPVSKRVTR